MGNRGLSLRAPAVTILVGACMCLASVALALAQEGQSVIDRVKWQRGPSMADMGGIAQIRLPAGYVFANAGDTRLLMEAMQNPTSGQELGFVGPESLEWFVVFEFDDIGYVKDDEKASLDADAILKSIKQGTEAANEERKKRGWPTMTIVGWELQPRYNPETHNLEWAIKGLSENHPVVNHNTRLLGRKGVMRVTLVSDPARLSATLPDFRNLLANFEFTAGNRYAEFVQGDKVAKYGLAALIVGGGAAVAAKAGVFKWLWKILLVGALAVAAFFRKIFGKKGSQ